MHHPQFTAGNLAIAHSPPWHAPPDWGLSLIFEKGRRPSAADILNLTQSQQGHGRNSPATAFAISYQPAPAKGWVELLADGLTFDLAGLAPGAAMPLPAMVHCYGMRAGAPDASVEAITLVPGEELRGARLLLPVLRAMTGMAARLAQMAHVEAVAWHPARSVMAPAGFVNAIGSWLSGGVFPAPGLTALFKADDGTIRSEGLACLTGQELLIDHSIGENTEQNLRIAAALVNYLVGIEPIHRPIDFTGPNGEQLSIGPSDNDGFLRVWRKS